jgi:uncharacterized protein
VNSAIYECEVVHQRLLPQKHGFTYRIFFLDLFLDELPWLHSELLGFAHNHFSLYSFYDRDHLPLGAATLRANLAEWLAHHGHTLEETDRVRFITLPRVMGYIFNPASFYFIYDSAGRVKHCMVQVTNTFLEIKAWYVPSAEGNDTFHIRVPKEFYVSPFSALDAEFEFRIRVPGEQLEIHIDTLHQGQRTLLSWIKGHQQSLTSWRLLSLSVRYPLMTLGVILRIHWQAFRLWWKRLPFIRKAEQPHLQLGLYRPHTSLTPS